MTMNSEKLVRLERMGLGPVWQLRARADEPVAVNATEVAALVAADFSALDWDELDPFDFDTITVNDVDGIVYLTDNKVVILSATTN
jgi:hypothetical protein